jgi:hypothetical protein
MISGNSLRFLEFRWDFGVLTDVLTKATPTAIATPGVAVLPLVVKAILGAFNIKPVEGEGVDDDISGRSVNSTITKI